MKRALVLVLPLLAIGLVACGDDDDSPDVTAGVTTPEVSTPDVTTPDLTLPDLSIPDLSIPDFSIPDFSIPENGAELLSQLFPKLDDEQIDCLLDAAGDITGSAADQSKLFEYLDECNISTSDLLPGS